MDPEKISRIEGEIYEGRYAEAEADLNQLLSENPDLVVALLLKAECEMRRERNGTARDLVQKALAGYIDGPRTAVILIRTLAGLSESGLILQIVKQLPTSMWDTAASLSSIAQQLSMIGAYEQAQEFALAAIQVDPDHLNSLHLLATLRLYFGHFQEAMVLAERCLALDPSYAASHFLISRLRQPGHEVRIARLTHLLERPMTPEQEVWLAFALHNELHDTGRFAEAWCALSRGCAVKRKLVRPMHEKLREVFVSLRKWTTETPSHNPGFVDSNQRPVFVIGLHRSGTTLVENCIAGHDLISAGGETYDFRAQLRRDSRIHYPNELDPRLIEMRDRLNYRQVGENYLRGMEWRRSGRPIFTDKLPSNYLNVGFIMRALPEARFIHVVRDPVEVGLSSLRTLFSHACAYSYDQDDFIKYHVDYSRLMNQWKAEFPDSIFEVHYSDLVAEPEVVLRRVSSFLKVEFQSAMLTSKGGERAVSTASSTLIRDGIRGDRGSVWLNYETFLSPMIEAFNPG